MARSASPYDQAMSAAGNDRKQRATGQMSFDMGGAEIRETRQCPLGYIQEFDKNTCFHGTEVMGIYISGHPLLEYADELKKACIVQRAQPGRFGRKHTDNQKVRLGGTITSVRTKPLKSGQRPMACCYRGSTGTIEFAAFPTVFNRCTISSSWIIGDSIRQAKHARGSEQYRAGGRYISAGKDRPGRLYLRLDMNDSAMVERIQTMLRRYPRQCNSNTGDAATKKGHAG